jgi:uncharacterized protein (DUF2147 family)
MSRGLFLLRFATLTLAALRPGAAKAGDPAGLWRSETGLSRYQVRHCGQGICVKIVWIVEGPEVRDVNNPDPSKRSRRVMGIDIASNFVPERPHRWTGSLYNFKNGQAYQGWAGLVGPNTLTVAGCVLAGVICIRQTLSRIQ